LRPTDRPEVSVRVGLGDSLGTAELGISFTLLRTVELEDLFNLLRTVELENLLGTVEASAAEAGPMRRGGPTGALNCSE
jgi:hypothetical protein